MKLNNITVKYGRKKAINDLSLNLKSDGSIIGILGPNGAGKTTLLNIILKRLNTFSGERQIHESIAYMPDRPFLYEDMKVKTAIKLFNDLFDDFDSQKAINMLNNFNIDLNMKLHDGSKGMHEQIHLSLILSRNTDFYILDEPLGAVDPLHRDYLLDSIKNYRNPSSSIIIVTHLIKDLEQLFDKVILLKKGKIVLNSNTIDIMENYPDVESLYREVMK